MTNASWRDTVIASLASLEVKVSVLHEDIQTIKKKAEEDDRLMNGRAFQIKLVAMSGLVSGLVSYLVKKHG